MTRSTSTDDELRQMAIDRLKKKKDFLAHMIAYVTVNLFLIGIWFVSGRGFFWPVFPILGWGIGAAFHAWDAFGQPVSESQVQREMERIRGFRTS